MRRWGSSTGNGAGWRTRTALSGGMSHTSSVSAMKSSAPTLLSCGSPSLRRSLGLRARPKRPLLATMTRSVTSRSTGLAAERNEPQAQEPLAPSPFCHTISPRGRRCRSSCRMVMTSAARLRYGLRPRLATLTAMRPPGSSTRLHSANTSRSSARYSMYEPGHALAVELLLVLLPGEVGGRGDDEGNRVVGHRVHATGIAAQARDAGLVRVDVLVGAQLRRFEAGVEGVRHVRLAAPDAEIGGRGATARRHGGPVEPYRPARERGRDPRWAAVTRMGPCIRRCAGP